MDEKAIAELIAIVDEGVTKDVEIDQTLYKKPDWAIDQIVRSSGLVENICRHGIGHPHPASVAELEKAGIMSMGIHGCDGCCTPGMREEIKRVYKEKWGDK
jgi:hypothetical protein